jgi:isopropylmalate/homocitrate/citramalate synthase
MTHITISEVGPRDGLQSVDTILSTEGKLAWIEAEYGAGVREIEVGSFVLQSCCRRWPTRRRWSEARSVTKI